MERTLNRILELGVILCLRLGAKDPLVRACFAAARGGLRVLEITMTTPGALNAMEELSKDPDLLVGAGTVLSAEQVHQVAHAGGKFILSPVFDPALLDEARRHDLLAIPGAATPTEILAAARYGARAVKVFPAEALGGSDYIRSVRGPLPDIPLIPTNGPTAENLPQYFEAGAVAIGVGRDLFPEGYTLDWVEKAAEKISGAVRSYRLSLS
jgi:2-dehydro-3-deoxyphosphogluconate aldolase/(4S)-4-hydroxy-2-oxoglutarate aldolase